MKALKKIFTYAEEYKNKIFLAVLLIFGSVLAGIIPYWIIYDIIIRFMEQYTVTPVYLLTAAGGVAFCLWLKTYLYARGLDASHEVAYDILMGMRIKFADKMTKMPMGEILEQGAGCYKKNLVDDIEGIELLIAHIVPEGLPYVITPIVVYVLLFNLDWRLALLSIINIAIGLTAVALMMRTGLKGMESYYRSAQKLNATIVEYITGMEVIKIFNRTTNSYKNYVSAVENYKKYTLAWFEKCWTYMAVYGAVLPCTIMFLLPAGTAFYLDGTLKLAPFVFALILSMSLGQPLMKLVQFFPSLPQLNHKIEQLEQMYGGSELKIVDKGLEPENYNVEFKNVSFAYKKKDVIKNVSFCAQENAVTAIVGTSGSGKSTLAKLLVHFWDVKAGEITIGGVNINDMSFERLMKLISYVAQDTFLFNISIMENIRIGKPAATDAEVIAAAKLARCHDFIMKMKKGYDSDAGDAGNKLSGGEKQRITIARAILKNAPIIILDEATAFSDPENEDKIQEGLNQLIAGKTLIVIAHRLSSIVEADNIVLLDDGNLLMQGSHKELLATADVYQSLWAAHTQSMNWDIQVKGGQHV